MTKTATYRPNDFLSGVPLPKGYDGADMVRDGWTAFEIEAWLRALARPWVPGAQPMPFAEAQANFAAELAKRPDGRSAPERAAGGPSSAAAPPPNPEPVPPAAGPAGGTAADMTEADWEAVWAADTSMFVTDAGEDRPDAGASAGRGLNRRKASQSAVDDPFEAMAGAMREWVFLSVDGEFCHVRTGERMSRAAFDLAMAPKTPLIEVMTADGGTKMKKLAPSKTLIEHLGGIVVSNSMYRPDVDAQVFEREGVRFLNSYLPSSVPEADPHWHEHEAWQIVRDHLHNIIPDGADQIIPWMAHNVQNPGSKILWAPIIVGVPGDGKTTLQKVMQAAMGYSNVQPVSNEALFSDFTSWAEGSCVRVLEEIRVHGNSRATAMDKLKPLITNEDVEIVRKGRDGKQIANVTNYMALSNHMDALAIDEHDRRWGVWRTRFDSRAQAEAELTRVYWERLYTAIQRHRSVIRGWLCSIDLSGFDRLAAPKMTWAKRLMIEASRTGPEGDVREALELGGMGVGPEVVATDCLNERIKETGGRQINTSALSNILRECGWAKLDKPLKWAGKNRRVYYRPDAFLPGLTGNALMHELRTRLSMTEAHDDSDGASTWGRYDGEF